MKLLIYTKLKILHFLEHIIVLLMSCTILEKKKTKEKVYPYGQTDENAQRHVW